MWRTLSIAEDGAIRDERGARVAFSDPEAVARAVARTRSGERPVIETRLASGEWVALAIERGRAILVPLQPHDELDVEKLAKIVSHDVRAPLRAVEAYTAFLAEDAGGLSEAAEEDLGRLRAATGRLRAYLDGLVDFLRAPRSPKGATASAHAVGAALVARFAPAFAERKGSLVLEGGDVRVPVAESVLEEQLARLVENVLVHHPGVPHARIIIGRDERDRARIEVSDDGPGLAPEERARVVELFRRRGGRQRGDERAGAGLAIVKRAVEAWGGDLVLAQAKEGGLSVRVDLPVAADARASAA